MKTYIGDVEAFEYCFENNIQELPKNGMEVISVPSIISGLPIKTIGKNSNGFYLSEESQEDFSKLINSPNLIYPQ